MQALKVKPIYQQSLSAEIGKYHPTAIIWVSPNRYTYCTSDKNHTGHYFDLNRSKFSRALALEIVCLKKKGYFVKIQRTTIEG